MKKARLSIGKAVRDRSAVEEEAVVVPRCRVPDSIRRHASSPVSSRTARAGSVGHTENRD